MSNELVFATNYAATLQRFADLEATIKEMKTTQEQIRGELLNAMTDYNIRSIDNDFVKITRVAPSMSVTIDTKKLQISDPDLYDELLEDYKKETIKKEHLRITVK